jgi:hypothetical protein
VKRAIASNGTLIKIRDKNRRIVGFFQSSCKGKDKLEEKLKLLKKPKRKLIPETYPRWNSSYFVCMLPSLDEQEGHVAASLSALASSIKTLRDNDWNVLAETKNLTCNLLDP